MTDEALDDVVIYILKSVGSSSIDSIVILLLSLLSLCYHCC